MEKKRKLKNCRIREAKNSPEQQSQSASDIGSKSYYCDHSFHSVVLEHILISTYLKRQRANQTLADIIKSFFMLLDTSRDHVPALVGVAFQICWIGCCGFDRCALFLGEYWWWQHCLMCASHTQQRGCIARNIVIHGDEIFSDSVVGTSLKREHMLCHCVLRVLWLSRREMQCALNFVISGSVERRLSRLTKLDKQYVHFSASQHHIQKSIAWEEKELH